MTGQTRADVKIGANVNIVLKADQRTGKRTEGIVAKLLTNSPTHPMVSGNAGRRPSGQGAGDFRELADKTKIACTNGGNLV